jgi:serine-type D-Ala-D-Ala carboxypeptidase/endopeptidase (penicillin-binding protein 4)
MKKPSYVLLPLLVCLLLIGVNPPFASAAENMRPLSDELDDLLNNDPRLQGAIAGVSVRSAATGEILYSHFGDTRLRPASNMKLLTAAAALNVLGLDHRFTTEIAVNGKITRKTLKGNLILRGKGDPSLLKSDFDKLAEEISKAGIKVIAGDLIGDDTWFDDVRYPIDLPWSDESYYYGAQISALTASPDKNYDAGTIIVEVHPGKKPGDPANVSLHPKTGYVSVVNQAITGGEEEKSEINISRTHGKNSVVIKGTIPVTSKSIKEWVAVWGPAGYALDLFRQSLKEQGIKIKGENKIGCKSAKSKTLLQHQSKPLSQLLVPFMKLSNNTHAEILIKEMGKASNGEGSWEKGMEVLTSQIQLLGMNTNTLVLRDGSGISHVNLIPANEITKLLYHIQKEKWFDVFVHSLPVSGASEPLTAGTLLNRMDGESPAAGRVRAKTGTLATVTSLSGYAKTNSGQKLIFAIILNNLQDVKEGKHIEDKIAEILCQL